MLMEDSGYGGRRWLSMAVKGFRAPKPPSFFPCHTRGGETQETAHLRCCKAFGNGEVQEVLIG